MAVPIRRARKRSFGSRLLRAVLGLAIAFYGIVIMSLAALRWVNPPTTALQMERRVQAIIGHTAYKKSYAFVPLGDISPNLQHAVIAAEDARFYQHHGFDWKQVQIAIEDDTERGKRRGASTITQQLVKNLFLGTSREIIYNGIRKGDRVHDRAAGGGFAFEAANPRTLPERDRMGTGNIWRGDCISSLLRCAGETDHAGRGGRTGNGAARAAATKTWADDGIR